MTRVKFCGLRSQEEVELAAELGIDHVGFVGLAPRSHRDLPLETIAALVAAAPPEVETVLVTPETEAKVVEDAIARVRPDIVQLTGTREEDLLAHVARRTGIQVWQAFAPSLDPDTDLDVLLGYTAHADAIVLDAMVDGYGGTGDPLEWAETRRLVEALDGFPVVLAGGLTDENVADAIRMVRPWAVDVSTGIEVDQRKDPERMTAFARAVEEAA